MKLGNSDSLQVGDQVVAVGNALALEGGLSVTEGIISGKGRVVPEDETGVTLYDMLQTDAAINPGNSGGPLVNANGEVVGINTALAGGSQNVGFAISIDSAKDVIRALQEGKSVQVAFLGVETSDVTPAVAKSLNLDRQERCGRPPGHERRRRRQGGDEGERRDRGDRRARGERPAGRGRGDPPLRPR